MSHGGTRDRRLGWGWSALRPVRRGDRRRLKPSLLALEDRQLLTATFTVTSTADTLTAGLPTGGTLRWAVEQADATPVASTIAFDLGSNPQTITLSQGVLALSNTSGSIAIDGPTAGLTISGGNTSSVFLVDHGVTAAISGLTITNGSAAIGGGVYNKGTVTLSDCTISGNSASYGGGVYNFGAATLSDCTISNNSTGSEGGGVYNKGTVTLTDCTISGNSANYEGGGIYNPGTATLYDSTISGSTARYGGGMFNSGTATLNGSTLSGNFAGSEAGGVFNETVSTLTDSTISGNSAAFKGGGAYNRGTATLSDCSISGNSATYGGGIFNFGTETLILDDCTISGNSAMFTGGVYNDSALVTLTDTIVAGNSDGDLGGTFTGSNNLIGTGGSGGLSATDNLLGVADPGLSPLGNYGGLTQTIALLPGSPALGAGTAVIGISTDQRGIARPGTGVDIGAFQSQGFTLTPVSGDTPQSATAGTAFVNPLAVSVTANDSLELVNGGVITFIAPSTGASANLSSATAIVGSNGVASVTATATAVVGSYIVTAATNGAAAPASFALDNLIVPLAFSGVSNPNIIYGTSTVSLSGTLANGLLAPTGETVAVTLDGVEQQATIGAGGTFSTTFGTAGLAVAGSPYTIRYAYSTDGTFASTSTTGTLTVTRATVMPVITVSSKVYDGTTTATLTRETLIGVIGGDAVSLSGGPAFFASKNVDTDQTVTVTGLSLIGAAAGNYQLASATATTMATISPALLMIAAVSDTKTYDGTTIATATPIVAGLVGADTVTGLNETFDTRDVGTSKTLTVTAYTINDGDGGADYNLTTLASTSGTITPATVSVSGVAAANKAYDGTTTATLNLSAAILECVLPGDTVMLDTIGATGTFASPHAGSNIAVTVSGLTLSGPQASDYTLTQQPSTRASIQAATTTIALTTSVGSIVYGQPVTFVTIANSSTATPVGMVTFSENGIAIATVPLNGSGQATLTTTSLALGSQAIAASYNGGADFVGELSASISVLVTRAATQIVLVPEPVFKKKKLVSLRLAAMVEPVAPAGGVPTGKLMLDLLVKQKKKITTKTLAISGVIGGQAKLTLNPNQVLNKAITIVYSGDSNYRASTASSTLTQNSLSHS